MMEQGKHCYYPLSLPSISLPVFSFYPSSPLSHLDFLSFTSYKKEKIMIYPRHCLHPRTLPSS
jgi:hypothetical protein